VTGIHDWPFASRAVSTATIIPFDAFDAPPRGEDDTFFDFFDRIKGL